MTRIRLTKNLQPIRASALARLDETVNARIHHLVASPLAIVRARKLAEAKRVLAGNGGAPMLTAEANSIGADLAGLAASVVAKAGAEAETLATVEAQRQAIQALIRAASTPAEIEAALQTLIAA